MIIAKRVMENSPALLKTEKFKNLDGLENKDACRHLMNQSLG